jgi:WhiB family redox-sensing transcriptional regulator
MRTAHRRQRGDLPTMTLDEHELAACRARPEVEFFPSSGNDGPAKAVCAECPVAGICLEVALETPSHDDHGILGGMTPAERSRERSRRRRLGERARRAR